jgi:V-type H+-transporting ATPase subunit e
MGYGANFVGATIVFLIVWVVASVVLAVISYGCTDDIESKGVNCRMSICLTFFAILCMWIIWACLFMNNMYPLLQPSISEDQYRSLCYYNTSGTIYFNSTKCRRYCNGC